MFSEVVTVINGVEKIRIEAKCGTIIRPRWLLVLIEAMSEWRSVIDLDTRPMLERTFATFCRDMSQGLIFVFMD
jgi:hypothetical protein